MTVSSAITMTKALVGDSYATIAITAGKGILLNSTISAPNANLVLRNNDPNIVEEHQDLKHVGISNNGSVITVHKFDMFDHRQNGVNNSFTNMNIEILGSVVIGNIMYNSNNHFVFSNNKALQINGGSSITGTADISTAAGFDITMVKSGINNLFTTVADDSLGTFKFQLQTHLGSGCQWRASSQQY